LVPGELLMPFSINNRLKISPFLFIVMKSAA
jgi:hypothetical protein